MASRALTAGEAIRHDDRLIPKICRWIGANHAGPVTSERLVTLSGYGRSRFFALFTAATGMPPNAYVVRRRIERAKELLASRPGEPVESVARRCGFRSSAFFCNAFRKLTGKTPTAFRRAL